MANGEQHVSDVPEENYPLNRFLDGMRATGAGMTAFGLLAGGEQLVIDHNVGQAELGGIFMVGGLALVGIERAIQKMRSREE